MTRNRQVPRVLVLNHFAAPRGQAGGTRHVELFSRLIGWQYLIIAADKNHLTGKTVAPETGLLPVATIGYKSNGLRRILNWVSYSWAAFWAGLRQRHVTVVYASSPHLLAGFSGLAVARIRRLPFVLEIRDLWPHILVQMGQINQGSAIHRTLTFLEEFLYRNADGIVVMAPGVRAELVARGVPSEKIEYIPNGADPEDFVPSADRCVLRQRYSFHRQTAIYAGAHGPANGLKLLLTAAAEASDIAMDIVLIGDGVEKPALRSMASELGLKNVRFMDPVPKNEIADVLAAADLGLHVLADVELFRSAVSPNKLFDYMAAGLPVLTNSPGIASAWVQEAQSGWAVPPNSLAEGLRDFESLPDATKNAAGRSGQRWLEENQSRSAMASRLSDMFEEVLARA